MGESNILLLAWRFIVLFAILYQGYLFGKARFPTVNRVASLPLGVVFFIATQSILQTAWYYAGGKLDGLSDVITLLVTTLFIAFFVWRSRIHPHVTTFDAPPSPQTSAHIAHAIPLVIIAVAAFVYILNGALDAATTESIRTPWPLLPSYTLIAIATLWLTLLLSLAVVRRLSLLFVHAALAIGGTTLIAPLLYRVGYGFDGFLHVASENILLRTGTLSPKPLYYIGQYVFTTWLSRLTDLPLAAIDRWLVPVAAALLIPLCLYVALRVREHHQSSIAPHASFLVLAILPLASFIATTPQSFAYVLSIAALILAAYEATQPHPTRGHRHSLHAVMLAAWATAVHPLAGIPVVLIVLALSFRHRLISWTLVVLSAAAIPLLFLLIGQQGATAISWNLSTLANPSVWLDRLASFAPWIGNHFVLWPAWASLVGKSIPVLLLAVAIVALIRTNDQKARLYPIPLLIGSAVLLWIAATMLKTTGDFAFLIDYERGNYADRLNMLALFCLIPAASFGFERLWQNVSHTHMLPNIALAGFVVMVGTGLSYDALPRHDALVTGHGWSVSSQDIEATKSIDRNAEGRRYTVLADQSVSAAAIQTLGFKRYAKNDVFFYPIPTGGPLYQMYLDVTYKQPTLDPIRDAAKLGESDLVYIVLNDYWWNADVVAEQLKQIANTSWDIDGKKIRIYKFDFNADSKATTATSTR